MTEKAKSRCSWTFPFFFPLSAGHLPSSSTRSPSRAGRAGGKIRPHRRRSFSLPSSFFLPLFYVDRRSVSQGVATSKNGMGSRKGGGYMLSSLALPFLPL